ncbi:MAG: TIGR00269 family protein [Brevinematia bacterium]
MRLSYSKCGIGSFGLELKSLGRCNNCSEEALVNIRYSKKKLCPECFSEFFVRRVRKTVEEFRMFKPGERVVVAVSGGKDSVALLHALKKAFPEVDILSFYINLGIKYYSDHLQEKVGELAEKLRVPLEVYDLRSEGYTIDDFLMTKYKHKMCSICGTIKRNIFTRMAVKVEANALATGHNLDDTVSTMLSLFFNGDFESIKRLKPVINPLLPKHPRKIKPLITTPEIEDLYYVYLNKLPVGECDCPYGEITPIKDVKAILDKLEDKQPDVKFRLLSVFRKKLIPLIVDNREKGEEVLSCKICGMPSSSEICSKCRKVEELINLKRTAKYESIEIDDVKELGGDVVLLDVRTKEEFLISTLPGAINIPLEELEKRLAELKPYKKTHKILVFCNTGRISYSATLKMRNLGFRAYNLRGGLGLAGKASSLRKE